MSAAWPVGEVSPGGMERIAGFLALVLRPGDVVALSGDLGTGKTAFARALIRHIAGGAAEEIPSPTFALTQTYDTPRYPVTHMDCYRLASPDELAELGLDEALTQGPVLVEWPERVAGALPADRLEVALADGPTEATRRLWLTGHGGWRARLERLRAMAAFCERAGWGAADVAYLQGDASPRAYARLSQDGERAILMDSPPMPDGPPIRDGKPYSAIARLAEDVRPYVAVAAALREAGFSAPEILAQDLEQGFLVVEELDGPSFGAAIDAGAAAQTLYTAAVDVLVALRRLPAPEWLPLPGGGHHAVAPYDADALGIEAELLLDWFWPAAKGEPAPATARAEFLDAWRPLFARLEEEPSVWVLRDYHSPNLVWLPQRAGIARVGLLDFQDALAGPAAYDLVSLAQDARRDVPPALEGDLFEHYCAGVGADDAAFDRERFGTAYAILGAQRNTKILGIFARLAMRDGKRGYLGHVPRVSAYLERNLAHPALAGVRAWFEAHLPPEARQRISGA